MGTPRSFGMTRREHQIMALHELGWSNQHIADELGLQRQTVASVVSNLSVGGDEAWKQEARRGSELLIAAIRQHHPERFTVSL